MTHSTTFPVTTVGRWYYALSSTGALSYAPLLHFIRRDIKPQLECYSGTSFVLRGDWNEHKGGNKILTVTVFSEIALSPTANDFAVVAEAALIMAQ